MKRFAVRMLVAVVTLLFGLAAVQINLTPPKRATMGSSVDLSVMPNAATVGELPVPTQLAKTSDLPSVLGKDRISITELSVVSLQFVNERRGWLSIDGKLWRTDDGGVEWKQVTFPWMDKRYNEYEYSLGGFQFLTATDGWLISDNQLYRTEDGGDSWQLANQPFKQVFPYERDPEGLSGFAFLKDGKHGWITGERFRPRTSNERKIGELTHEKYSSDGKQVLRSFIYYTIDGGRTWTLQPVAGDSDRMYNARYNLEAIDNQHALATGMNGVFYLSNGRWEQVGPAEQIHGADCVAECLDVAWGALATYATVTSFLNSEVGWLANTNGRLGKTSDGGKTWTDIFDGFDNDTDDIGASRWGSKIYFVDSNRGWGLDGNGRLLSSADAGNSWSVVDGNSFQELFILDSQNGWVVSNTGIFRIP